VAGGAGNTVSVDSSASARALPTRFRFASGSARSSNTQGDLEELLRKRLRFIVVVFLASRVAFAAIIVLRNTTLSSLASQRELGWHVVSILGAETVLYAWATWRLRPGARHTLAFLRNVELGGVTLWMIATFAFLYTDFPSLVDSMPSAAMSLGVYSAGICALGVVAYGVLIPNTWRRCLTVMSVMVVACVLPDIVNVVRFDVAAYSAIGFLITKAGFVTIFAALAVYGSYRIELSETAARAATQLGQYLLRDRLGSGGMGEVYKAEHQFLRRPCAVKLIRPEHAGDAEVLQRFEREVQATSALTHPNTVAIYDYGIADDGTFYYVMEYLPGQTLEEIVAKEGPMAPERVVHLLRQVASALHEAHTAGLTHRDIKPGNVMVCERGGIPDVAKLLDFGLVVTSGLQTADAKLTQAGMILGTPAYMSPEQCSGDEHPGPASDIYSTGALAYFLLSGRSPFEGRGSLQMLMAHMGEVPPRIGSIRAEIPVALDAVVMKCLAKRPEDRYGSAAELERALVGGDSEH
jgi:hypothetical protein